MHGGGGNDNYFRHVVRGDSGSERVERKDFQVL